MKYVGQRVKALPSLLRFESKSKYPRREGVLHHQFKPSACFFLQQLPATSSSIPPRQNFNYFPILALLTFAAVVEPPDEKKHVFKYNLNQFIEKNHLTCSLTDKQLNQLGVVQENKVFTPQADIKYSGTHSWTEHLHRDVQRAVVGLHILNIFLSDQNPKDIYDQFIELQSKDDRLNYAEFCSILRQFKSCSQEEREALSAAVFIQATSLSPRLVGFAKSHLGEQAIPYDSVMFSGKTIQYCPEIYDIWPTEMQAQLSLKACFPYHEEFPQLHFRHIFYTEGNQGMYQHLRHMIISNQITSQEFKIWCLFWLLDLIKFNGHVNPHLSFLTRDVYIKYQAVVSELEKLFVDPDHDVLMHYFEKQASYLEIRIHAQALPKPFSESAILLATHIALMLNLKPEETDKIKGLLDGLLEVENLEKMADSYAQYCRQISVTTTYQPALLNNIYDYLKKNYPFDKDERQRIKRTIAIGLPIIVQGLNYYAEAVTSLSEGLRCPPLSYRRAAEKSCTEGFVRQCMKPSFNKKNNELGCELIHPPREEKPYDSQSAPRP